MPNSSGIHGWHEAGDLTDLANIMSPLFADQAMNRMICAIPSNNSEKGFSRLDAADKYYNLALDHSGSLVLRFSHQKPLFRTYR